MSNKSIPRIEGILQYYTKALGDRYNPYRNHVYRVYHLTLLLCADNIENKDLEQLAIAAAFHDLGVWTHSTMDYLGPSIDLANDYMDQNAITEREKVLLAIDHHHQITEYKGVHQRFVEAFRRSDLVDLSFGLIRFGLPKNLYSNLKEDFPYLGFHPYIIGKVIWHAFSHITRPFPMMKK